MLSLPCKVGRSDWFAHAGLDLTDVAGNRVGRASDAPNLLLGKMVRLAEDAFERVAQLDRSAWLGVLAEAGRILLEAELPVGKQPLGLEEHSRLVSRISGIPEARVRHAVATLAEDLEQMAAIVAAQRLDSGPGWLSVPAGRHVAVRVPGNFPTININWLIALALRRPVLVAAPLGDPLTALRLVEALYRAGAPDGVVSLVYGDALDLWHRADQVLWPGDGLEVAGDGARVKRYHHGRSKVLWAEGSAFEASLFERLARLAVQGAGRLCTNPSGVVVIDGDARAVADGIASALSKFEPLPLAAADAYVPAFPSDATARRIEHELVAAESRGAVDCTARFVATPRRIEREDATFLRPSVFLVDAGDSLFGAELPFPFITVAQVAPAQAVAACRRSLVVSLVGGDRALFDRLVAEPTIDKVFWGDHFDRGYRPTDPHEGFLADFLFKKKAVHS